MQTRPSSPSSSAPAPPPAANESLPTTTLEAVLANAELAHRPARAQDYRAEAEALSDLAHTMVAAPQAIFQKLADAALRLGRAQSAGLSLMEESSGEKVFRWRATSGAFAPLVGTTLPRDASPCGAVLDRDAMLLMIRPVRHFPSLATLPAPVEEVLLVPFRSEGIPIGTLWITAHDPETHFDAEDARVMTNLSQFASAAWEAMQRRETERARASIADRFRRLMAIHETVLSTTNDFAFVFDPAGKFLYANRPLLAVLKRTFDEVIGRSFSELGYPDWRAEHHRRDLARVIATKEPLRGEIPLTSTDGRETSGIYDYIFTPVIGPDGEVEAIAGTARDVTERKRREDRDRLLVALDDATRPLIHPQAVTQISAKLLGEHLRVNRCAYADVEVDENTFHITGDFCDGVPSIVGRYRFEQFGAECLRHMQEDQPFIVSDAETDPRTASERASYLATQIRSVICVPLKKSGRFVAAMAVHQTTPRTWLPSEVELVQLIASRCWESIERTRVIRVLAESEQRLRLAVETGRLGVWELDLPTRTLTSSAPCKAIYGRDPAHPFSYAEMTVAIHPEDRERVQLAMDNPAGESGEFDLEHRTIWADGTEHWILVRGQASGGAGGESQRIIGVSLDITARKEAEHEQVRLREEAVRASRAKDEFLATLSHELRTPLNPVLLVSSDAARDPNFPAEARAAFETIRKNAEVEARLIDDLLDLTAIVRGKLTIKKGVNDLNDILTHAVAAVQPEFDAKEIALAVTLAAEKHTVFADEVRLGQVFINLLKNAAKFSPDRSVVSLDTELGPEGLVTVRLADTGIGMTPQELNRVFGAFEQGDHAGESSAHRFGGLGLGLAISHRLVEFHQGIISAASRGRDQGTTFTVTLPLHLLSEHDELAASAPPRPPLREASLHEGKRILLVEDHAPTRKTLEQLLRRRNYHVTSGASLAEARERSKTGEFDLVISDLGLPDGDGAALMAELRDHFGLRGIALTGYGMLEDIARCRASGFVTHLTKPIRVEALEAALQEFSESMV